MGEIFSIQRNVMEHKKYFSRVALSRYNGEEGKPIYFAYEGKVYDATDSFLWKKGRHQAMHNAGKDLTGCLKDAPHGKALLERLPIIGILID